MSDELSPHLQEIQDRFVANYANGGLPAVELMIDDLAVEVEAAFAFAGTGKQIYDEAIADQDTQTPEEMRNAAGLDRDTAVDVTTAISRHSFALYLRGVVKIQNL